MRAIRAINHMFIADKNDTEEGIHWSDYAWFYGFFTFIGSVVWVTYSWI